jgi:hypothetical protein
MNPLTDDGLGFTPTALHSTAQVRGDAAHPGAEVQLLMRVPRRGSKFPMILRNAIVPP